MIQLLIILVEWIALAGLTLLGIGYERISSDCPPAAGEPASIHYVETVGASETPVLFEAGWHLPESDGCATSVQPEFVAPSPDDVMLIRI